VHHRCPALIRSSAGRLERRFLFVGQEIQRIAQESPAFPAWSDETYVIERYPPTAGRPGDLAAQQPGGIDLPLCPDDVHVLPSGARQVPVQFDLEACGTPNLTAGYIHDHCGGHVVPSFRVARS
jgi:hypothetical protein